MTVEPNLDRIDAALGQYNDARFLGYTVLHALCVAQDQERAAC
jgi:hypothetical protein